MYKVTEADISASERQTTAATQARPNDLKLLKRAVVRDACTKHTDWDMDSCRTLDRKQVSIGMTSEKLLLSWGQPNAVNTTMTAKHVRHEQWVYNREYLYVDNGILSAMQTSQ